MPHDTLDERLRRYYGDVPALNVPRDHAAPIARARQRHRHQVTGLVAAAVLVIAGLGTYARTLLDHDEHSSGPVAVEGDDRDGAARAGGQRWIIGPEDPELTARGVFSPWPTDDGTMLVLAAPVYDGDEVIGAEVWEVDGEQRTTIDTGLDAVDDMTIVDGDIWAAGRVDDELAVAISADDGRSWDVHRTAEPLTSWGGVNIISGGDFAVAYVKHGGLERPDVLISFELRSSLEEIGRREAAPPSWPPGPVAGGVMFSMIDDPQMVTWTHDGREWIEVPQGDQARRPLGLVGDDLVWFDSDGVITAGDTSTELADLVELEDPFALTATPTDDGLTILVLATDYTGASLISTTDGRSWSVVDLIDPPAPFQAPGAFARSELSVDASGDVVITSVLQADRGRITVPAALVVDLDAPPPPDEPEGSDSATTRARATADAFVEAWRDGDREAMLELVDDASVVDNAFAIASPNGEITRCSRQANGQFECVVDTTDTYSAYIQVGPPGGPDGVVSWVGPVAQ